MRVNYKTKVAIFTGIILGAIALPVAGVGSAYADDIVRVRGTIESVDGSTYVVKTRAIKNSPNRKTNSQLPARRFSPTVVLWLVGR